MQQKESPLSTFQLYPLYVPVQFNICLVPKQGVLGGVGVVFDCLGDEMLLGSGLELWR